MYEMYAHVHARKTVSDHVKYNVIEMYQESPSIPLEDPGCE